MLAYKFFLFTKKLVKYLVIGFILYFFIWFLYAQINKYQNLDSFNQEIEQNLGMYNAIYQISKPNLVTIYAQKSLYYNENELIFKQIKGLIKDLHYKEIEFSSNQGVFNKVTNKLDFLNQVIITSPQGLHIIANQAIYHLEKQIIKAINKVNVTDYMGNITAHKLDFNLAQKIYDFSGNVVATNDDNHMITGEKIQIDSFKKEIKVLHNPQYKDEDIILNAQKFRAFYQENQANKWQLQKIIADQNVKITSQDTIIYANQAEYYPDKKQCLIFGNVELNKDGNIIKGQKLIYNVITDSFKIISKQENKVNLKLKKKISE